ncbi:FAD-dependent oxidoreductase [Sphingomonas kyeonggiensis]|uniref:2-polyprenyl-6-methoxyphenol hydroxylase-like FAD-dependent oxidoreductase n=1 Tax=Sphingomonas kyeonggiensis TaxID=1268553 RepID=A0A7W6JTR7_9SPHN|nr:FAD-dependent oxidoreductase [Sphingomonas kyeonggiensis]MBB4099360.1 2-polyprenyl-6-methoxyphenol hydroxylase-like FAD-dependent oxidoreductase [Sphingomonas kyeonggiensis]
MSFDTEVLISGAGAAGLALAIDLARRGIAFSLIEQSERPFGGSRGKGIQPRTLEVFEDLGMVDRLAAAGAPYPPLRQYRSDGATEESLLTGEELSTSPSEPYVAPLMVAQFRTEAVMRERLAELGHRPHFGRRLTGFEQDEEGVSARVADAQGEHPIRARFLIGTDGGRSFIRHALNIGFPGETLGVRALVADVRLKGLDRLAWHRFQLGSPVTQLMVCPLAGTDLFQLQGPVALEGDVDLSPAALTGLIAQRTGRSDIVVREVSWASVYAMNARLADHYRVGRVFLAGDAAHTHPPTGGQGLNTSIQDAYNLGWKLAAVISGGPDTLLDTYEEERRPIAAGMLGLATRLLGEAKAGTMRRDREARQLDLGYRTSSLSRPSRSSEARLQPGDRAPDAPCRGQAGQQTRLFNVFAGPHWTLLGFDVAERPLPRAGLQIALIGEQGDLVDEAGYVAHAYGLTPGQWALVRPDGYLAAIVDTGELDRTLRSFFDTTVGTTFPEVSA